jgi:hypothetical protein
LHSRSSQINPVSLSSDRLTLPYWFRSIMLVVWLAACVIPFLPFAVSTAPLDAVMFHVPGDQGNWWHFLAGLPFFLAFLVLWLSAQSLLGSQGASTGLRTIAGVAALSGIGTVLVEVPFLLHLAGTSAWQTFTVLGLGLGILLVGAVILILRRRSIPLRDWCIGSLLAAYLANASLCLIVYASAPGAPSTRTGWFLTLALVWPIAPELLWILAPKSRPRA